MSGYDDWLDAPFQKQCDNDDRDEAEIERVLRDWPDRIDEGAYAEWRGDNEDTEQSREDYARSRLNSGDFDEP